MHVNVIMWVTHWCRPAALQRHMAELRSMRGLACNELSCTHDYACQLSSELLRRELEVFEKRAAWGVPDAASRALVTTGASKLVR